LILGHFNNGFRHPVDLLKDSLQGCAIGSPEILAAGGFGDLAQQGVIQIDLDLLIMLLPKSSVTG